MYSIKRENEEVLCNGCLSSDRRLSPLANYEMYFALLGNNQSVEAYKYLNILLCWECQALLRRTQGFRSTLQRAQYTLSLAAERISSETLSTLNYYHKKDYDCSIEESIENIEAKCDVEILIDNSNIVVKNESYHEKIEENLENNFENDFDTFSDNCKEEKDIKPVTQKKRPKRKETEKREFKKIDNGLDFTKPEKYFSEVCLSEIEVEEALAMEREDDISRPQGCQTCGFLFVNKTELNDHKKYIHKQRTKKVKCPHCTSTYKTLWDLELHCWKSHPVNRCVICRRIVGQSRDMAKHLTIHRFRYRCLKCQFDLGDKQWFIHHEKQLHSKYMCDHCGQTKNLKKSLEMHVIRHHLPSKCGTCGLVLRSWERLRRHALAQHESSGPAYCVECDTTYPSAAKYRRHLSQSARHRPKVKLSIPCPECSKTFSRTNYLNNHRKLFHSNQSRHHCPLCDKYFVNSWGLRTHHKSVHEKIPLPKTKICTVCGRAFGTNRVLENHMRTHTGERPFACAHCPAAFAQRVALKAHLAAIHKEK